MGAEQIKGDMFIVQQLTDGRHNLLNISNVIWIRRNLLLSIRYSRDTSAYTASFKTSSRPPVLLLWYQLIWTFLPSSRKAISCCVQRFRICHIKKLRIELFDNFNYKAVIINNCGTRWLVNFMIWYLTSCVSTQCGGLAATILQFTVSMLTPGRIIDSESRLVTTLTLIARQRADTALARRDTRG